MIKAIKNTLTFDLYKNNKNKFHRWLYEKRVNLGNSAGFWVFCIFSTVFLATAASVQFHNMTEISEYEYRSLIQDEEKYAEQYPEWKVMLEDAMDDGVVTESENDDMRSFLVERYKEKALMKKLKTRAELTKIIND